MKLRMYRTLCVSTLVAFFPFAHAHGYVFSRDLTLGSHGEDVRQLQIELNKSVATQVSYSGIGAPGQETDYFGPKTQAAVVRYQNLNASKILTPLGLTKGTGYVGASTRALLSGGGVTTTTSQSAPVVTSLYPQRGGVGTTITLTGSGFLPTGNKISSVFEEFNNVSSVDGKTLTITINGPFPKDFLDEHKDFYKKYNAEMDYEFVVTNKNGYSASLPFRFVFY